MELQMFRAKILAALFFFLLLQANQASSGVTKEAPVSVPPPPPPSNGTKPPMSPNNNNNNNITIASSTSPPPPQSPPPRSSRWKRVSKQFKKHFTNFTPEFNWEQQQYLKAHNDLRQKMGIPPLEWDAGLMLYAHSWAIQRREDCKYRDHSQGLFGENSFWMQYKDFTPTEVVQCWFSEQKFFDHKRNVCKCKIENEDCECGHYLNVIWKTTKKMGCSGYVYCSDQQGLLVYCSYDPRGNYKGVNPLDPENTGSKLPRHLSDISL